MNEKELMSLLNSIDDDLIDKKIDELLNEKGDSVNMENIKEKALKKLNQNGSVKKSRRIRKSLVAAALVATLAVPTVYADEISNAIKSFFNKTTVYNKVVDGDAFYLPNEVKLNEDLTLLNASVSEENMHIIIKSDIWKDDSCPKIFIEPKSDESIRLEAGGYGIFNDNEWNFFFYKEGESDFNVQPFKDFKLLINDEPFDISLEKAESVKVENLTVGEAAISYVDTSVSVDSIATVAGILTTDNGKTNIQIIPAFEDKDLRLSAIGTPLATEFISTFENFEDGSAVGSRTSSITNEILAYDKNNNSYVLQRPEKSTSTNTFFSVDEKAELPLTVKIPAISAHYEKQVTNYNIPIPKEGEIAIDKELDFIIQKAILKSVKRTSEDTAIVEFELNTGDNKSVSIIDISAISPDVKKGEIVITGNKAVMTLTFENNIEEANFTSSWAYYLIEGDWSIELNEIQ